MGATEVASQGAGRRAGSGACDAWKVPPPVDRSDGSTLGSVLAAVDPTEVDPAPDPGIPRAPRQSRCRLRGRLPGGGGSPGQGRIPTGSSGHGGPRGRWGGRSFPSPAHRFGARPTAGSLRAADPRRPGGRPPAGDSPVRQPARDRGAGSARGVERPPAGLGPGARGRRRHGNGRRGDGALPSHGRRGGGRRDPRPRAAIGAVPPSPRSNDRRRGNPRRGGPPLRGAGPDRGGGPHRRRRRDGGVPPVRSGRPVRGRPLRLRARTHRRRGRVPLRRAPRDRGDPPVRPPGGVVRPPVAGPGSRRRLHRPPDRGPGSRRGRAPRRPRRRPPSGGGPPLHHDGMAPGAGRRPRDHRRRGALPHPPLPGELRERDHPRRTGLVGGAPGLRPAPGPAPVPGGGTGPPRPRGPPRFPRNRGDPRHRAGPGGSGPGGDRLPPRAGGRRAPRAEPLDRRRGEVLVSGGALGVDGRPGRRGAGALPARHRGHLRERVPTARSRRPVGDPRRRPAPRGHRHPALDRRTGPWPRDRRGGEAGRWGEGRDPRWSLDPLPGRRDLPSHGARRAV